MESQERQMRVTFITDRARSGTGPNRRVVGCLNAISSLKEVRLTLVAAEADSSEPFASRLERLVLGYRPHKLAYVLSNLWIIWRATRKCDIIYVSNGLHNFLYGWLFRRKRRKFIAGPSITPIPFLCPPADPNRLMTVNMVDTWIEQSEIRALYTVSGGAGRDEFVVLRNCLDLAKFSPDRCDRRIWGTYGLDPLTPKIIFASRRVFRPNSAHRDVKGTYVLLEAYRKVCQAHTNVDLIVVGGPPYGEYKEKYGSTRGIHFLGPMDDDRLPIAYASSDVGCITSVYEGSCWTGTEMFASGLPLVSSKVGIMPELIEHGVSGLLFELFPRLGQEPYDDASDRLATAVRVLLEDREYAKLLGKNGRKQAVEKLSVGSFAAQLLAVFRSVVAGGRTPWPQAATGGVRSESREL